MNRPTKQRLERFHADWKRVVRRPCHDRAWPGHPRFALVDAPKSWVTGPSSVMTQDEDGNAGWVSSHDETALVDRIRRPYPLDSIHQKDATAARVSPCSPWPERHRCEAARDRIRLTPSCFGIKSFQRTTGSASIGRALTLRPPQTSGRSLRASRAPKDRSATFVPFPSILRSSARVPWGIGRDGVKAMPRRLAPLTDANLDEAVVRAPTSGH